MKAEFERKFNTLFQRYKNRRDPWGLNLATCRWAMETLWPLYYKYFDVRIYGKQYLQDKPYIVTSNHSGQIPIDGLLIGLAFALDTNSPRILRAMVERFLAKLPFLGEISAKLGAIVGNRENAHYLLKNGESLLVFPEGVRGISKNTRQFYQLQSFPSGFVKIAASTQTPILPIAVIGAEEFYPYVYHFRGLAKKLGLPALPITPFFPWFGLLGTIPFPSAIDIYIGEEITPPKNHDPHEIQRVKRMTEEKIKKMIQTGLELRRPYTSSIKNIIYDKSK